MVGEDILRFLFKNRVTFLADIPVSLFAKKDELEIFQYFKQYIEKYNELPNKDSFVFHLGDSYKNYLLLVDKVFKDSTLSNFVEKTLLDNIKLQKWRDSLIKGIGYFDSDDSTLENMDKVFSDILKAKTFDVKPLDKPLGLEDCPIFKKDSYKITKPFLKEWELMLEDSGFFTPQNIVIMGGAKSFKTGLLIVKVADFFLKGKHVYVADVENGVERTTVRIFQALMGYTKTEVRDNFDKCIEYYNYCRKINGGSITIKGYRQKVDSVINVEIDIDNTPEYKPDVIIYDYLDIMGGKNSDKRLNIQDNYYAASALNKKYGCFSFTVSKITDKGMYKKVNKPTDIAEDKEKLYNADAVYSLSRTEQDIEDNIGRICPLLIRDGLNYSKPIEIRIDDQRMKITINDDYKETGEYNKRVGFDDFSERLG